MPDEPLPFQDGHEPKHERVANLIAESNRLSPYQSVDTLRDVAREILLLQYGTEPDTTAGATVAVLLAIKVAAEKIDRALLSPYDYESRAQLFDAMIREEVGPVLETIRSGVGAVEIALLTQIRAEGWLVALHQDQHHDGDELTHWLFVHQDHGFAQGMGETDLEALVRARTAIDAIKPAPSEVEELRLALRRIRMKNDEGQNIIQQQSYKIADEALGGEQP